ncbi:DUF4351 domain-containing protein [Calderihabitans maritimus]|uniref:DUF4351 domain-containing protein n=1 Tax=Calderihabitans maritimus TaxID=1246530 RepID=UPI000B50DC77|nr:DUF4351 domain-containing protein [Calderihabitans maritimus]
MQPKSGNRYDITIKDLFADGTEDLINYFSDIRATVVNDLKIEFPQVETRFSDLVVEAMSEQGPLAIHLEFQSHNDREMPYRMLRYALEIHKTYRLPVYQVVIYLGQREMNMAGQLHYRLGTENMLDYRYRLVDLGKLNYEELRNTPYQQLRSLLPLVDREKRNRDKEKFLRQCVEDIIASNLDQEAKKTALFRAEIFAGLIYDKQTIDAVFQEVEKMLGIEESAGYQRIFEKGMKKGMEEGRKEGREESLVDITIRLLIKKFRKLPKEYVVRIKEQDTYVLQQLIDNIFDINELSELDDYLH